MTPNTDLLPDVIDSFKDEPSPELQAELKRGDEAANAIALHLHRMQASGISDEYTFDGQRYTLTVRLDRINETVN